jgi:hypothetical protein
MIMALFLACFMQACLNKPDNPKALEEQITQLDKAGWEAWKQKDGAWFEANTTKNFVSISSDGVSNKEEVIRSTVHDCDIQRYTLSQMKFDLLSEGSVLLTYTVEQDGSCGGVKLHPKIRVAANYIRQNDKWLEAFYMESKMD